MYRHDRLNSAEEFSLLERIFQIYRNQTGLPVMTMDDIRAKTDNRKGRQCCFTEERKFLNVLINLSIWTISAKIKFII